MGRSARLLAAATLLLPIQILPLPLAAGAQDVAPQPQPPTPVAGETTNRAVGHAAWDDDYLYLTLQVSKSAINGKNREPFSNPLEDDAALFSFQIDNDRRATQRTDKTVTLAVSAVGGVNLYLGPDAHPLYASFQEFNARLEAVLKEEKDPDKQREKTAALLGQVVKYQVTPKGAPRNSGAAAPGYTVEVAVPWVHLGGKPEPGRKIGFHAAVQSVPAALGTPALMGLSPAVKTAADLNNPSLWGELVFSNAPAPAQGNSLVAPRVLGARPNIDGEVGAGEWNPLSLFEFGERVGGGAAAGEAARTARERPEFKPRAPLPVLPLTPSDRSSTPPVRKPGRVIPLILAGYHMDYQGDPRKVAPAQNVQAPNGGTLLAQHPLSGTGPWMSYDSVDWHRQQLEQIREAGVDVALPIYHATGQAKQADEKALLQMAHALQWLRNNGRDYPQVGLMLDTESLIAAFGERPSLKEAATQDALYNAVRDFYRAVPAPFRLIVGGAYTVFLSRAGAFRDVDGAFVENLRARFYREFGTDLMVLGDADFKSAAKMDGYFASGADLGAIVNASGSVKIATLTAGRDVARGAGAAKSLPRRGGDTYRQQWIKALAARPDWVLLPEWNDYESGAAIAPTAEFGVGAADLTRVYARQFAGAERLGVKFLSQDVPDALVPGQTYLINVRAQNTGITAWGPNGNGQEPVQFAYRWRRGGADGAVVAQSGDKNTVILTDVVTAGQNTTVTLPILVSPQEPGAYTLEIGPVSLSKGTRGEWMGESTGRTLQVPVLIARGDIAPWAISLVATDLPTTPENGGVYKVKVTLRNDGGQAWSKSARVIARLVRLVTGDGGKVKEEYVTAADASAEMKQDVPPGQEITTTVQIPFTTPEGEKLPAWKQGDNWTYALRWEVSAENGARLREGVQHASLAQETVTPRAGALTPPMPIGITDFDFGVRFTLDGTPSVLPGERRLPVRIGIQNNGPQTWKKGQVGIGYHWYYADGAEFLWEDETTPLAQDVPPGARLADTLAWVTAPPRDGTYWLVWDLKVGDAWASTSAASRPFDRAVTKVTVTGGRLTFPDLTKAYNLDGVSDAGDTDDGDLDGKGRTLPASLVPPFADMTIAPARVWQPTEKTGPDSPRRLSFRWGPKEPGAKNFVACRGQKLDLGTGGPCRVLHILAAATGGKDVFSSLKLIFKEPSTQSQDLLSISVPQWDRAPGAKDVPAYLFRRLNTRTGDEEKTVALYQISITLGRDARNLVGIQLPDAPDIKIAAITLEK